MSHVNSPDYCAFRREELLGTMGYEHATLRKMLENYPEDQLFSFKPHDVSMNGGTLFWHCLGFGYFVIGAIAKGEFSMHEEGEIKAPDTKAGLLEAIAQASEALKSAMSGFSPDQLAKPISFFGGPPMSAVEYFGWYLNHLVHHRGQLSVYMRLLGAKVPSIYGGSHDEPMMG